MPGTKYVLIKYSLNESETCSQYHLGPEVLSDPFGGQEGGLAVLGAPALSCPATLGPVGHLTPGKVLNTCSQEIGSFKGACGYHRQTSLLQGLWLGSVSLDTTQSSEVHHPSSKAPPSLPRTPPRVSAGGLMLRSVLIRFSYHQEYFQRAVPSRGTGQDPGASLTDPLASPG